MYVRFVILRCNESSGVREGVFKSAYALRREGQLPAHEYTRLNELLVWFGGNLPVPYRFNRTKSKGYSNRNSKGISWLKPTARRHVRRMWELKDILDEHGYFVTVIKTERPGYIVYEDNVQIVAEPFSDTTA